MANGTAALSLVLDPPAADPRHEIGEAIANAAVGLCGAVLGFAQTGALDPETKNVEASRLARISMLMLDHAGGDEDFFDKARAAGKAVLRERLNGKLNTAQHDAVLDFYVNELLEIVSYVVRDERAFRRAMSN